MTGLAIEISSSANSTFKKLASLLVSKGMQKSQSAILSGETFIHEIIKNHIDRVTAWITGDDTRPPPGIPRWYRLSKPLFAKLDVFGTNKPLITVSAPELALYDEENPWPVGCTLFIPFQNPDNCGAVIRTAAAFGVKRVVLLKEAAHPFHPKSTRAAGPALFEVDLQRGPSINDLSFNRMPFVSLSGEGDPLANFRFPETFALIPGIEGPGVPAHLRSHALSIPISPAVESLNAATATAIALYEWKRGL